MEVVSQAFKDAAKSLSRETRAFAELRLKSVDFPEVVTFEGTNTNPIISMGAPTSVLDNEIYYENIAMFENYLCGDEACFPLDGTVYLPVRNEMGYWDHNASSATANIDGYYNFPTPITLRYNFDSINISEVSIKFANDEYPGNMTVNIDTVVNKEISNNTDSSVVVVNENPTADVFHVELIIYDWVKPNTLLKINSILNGLVKVYTDRQITDLSINEQIEFLPTEIPMNDCSLTLENINDDFNILKPGSLYKYLARRPELKFKMGFVTNEGLELLNMGTYDLYENSQNKTTITLRGYDTLRRYDGKLFYGMNRNWDGDPTTIKNVISELMNYFGVYKDIYTPGGLFLDRIYLYNIPTELSDYTFDAYAYSGWIDNEPLSIRQVLTKIRIMYDIDIWVDRNGILQFGYFNEYPTGYFPARTLLNYAINRDNIGLDGYKVGEQEQMKVVSWNANAGYGMDTNYQNLTNVKTYTVSGGNPIIIRNGQLVDTMVRVKGSVTYTGTASLILSDPGISLLTDGYNVIIPTTGEGTAEFQLEYLPIGSKFADYDQEINNESIIPILQASTPVPPIYTDMLNIPNGYLVNLNMTRLFDTFYEFAPTGVIIGNIYAMFLRNRQLMHTIDWRQDLALQVGDIVEVETEYGYNIPVIVTGQSFKYNGALSGTTTAISRLESGGRG